MKEKTKKILSIIKKIITGIGFFFAAIFSVLLVKDKNKYDTDVENKIKEDKENEIKETNAADIINNSPNQDDIQQSISDQQEAFRRRIRDRLKSKV